MVCRKTAARQRPFISAAGYDKTTKAYTMTITVAAFPQRMSGG